MRWTLCLAVVLAGCFTTPVDTDVEEPAPEVTCADTSTSGVPAACMVGDCVAFLQLRLDYAAAGNDPSSQVFGYWSHSGLGIADLQDESDHQHFLATGEGRYNMTGAASRTFSEWVDDAAKPQHTVLAWFAATDTQVEQAFCDAWRATPNSEEGDWKFSAYGGYDATRKNVDGDSLLAQAFCDAWLATWDSAEVVEPEGGHHGQFCRED